MRKKFFKWLAAAMPAAIISAGYFVTPKSIVLTENAAYSAYPNGFVRLCGGAAPGRIDTAKVGTKSVSARLFGALPIKTVRVSVVPEREVVVSGAAIGVRLYCDGIMVIEVENDGPARLAGLRSGDIITEVNGEWAESSEQLSEAISGGGSVSLTVKTRGVPRKISLCGEDGERGMKAGMWVRDSAAGIGTMSFYDPQTLAFASLGHPICDSDTGDIVPIRRGSISDCTIYSVKKGVAGDPGELVGSIGKTACGSVAINDEPGLYGTLDAAADGFGAVCATRFLVKEGAAELYCDIGGGVERFSCEIEEVSKSRARSNKSMVVRVTDARLLERCGGIVQGMSGAPIVQNGRLVGAVTHVFVGDPTRGYAIFAENMMTKTDELADIDSR